MTLLLTGGCGFIGSNAVRALLGEDARALRACGYERLVNLDALTYAGHTANLADCASHPAYRFVHGDIADAGLVSSLLAEHRVRAVLHLAAESHVDRSIDSAEPFVQTNVLGTQRLLDAVRRHWRSLPPGEAEAFRFVHVSTDEVFGSLAPEDPPFCESTPLAPNSPYAASKAAADCLVRAAWRTHRLPVVTTNCSNNYGPYQFPEKLIPLMLLNALEGRPLPVYGDGRQVRDWLFVGDHVSALLAALTRGVPGRTYCIGGGNEVANIELVRAICALLDQRVGAPVGASSHASLIAHVADRPGHDRRYAIDAALARRELAWTPRETFASGLARTVDWYLAHRDWAADIARGRYDRRRLGTGAPPAPGTSAGASPT